MASEALNVSPTLHDYGQDASSLLYNTRRLRTLGDSIKKSINKINTIDQGTYDINPTRFFKNHDTGIGSIFAPVDKSVTDLGCVKNFYKSMGVEISKDGTQMTVAAAKTGADVAKGTTEAVEGAAQAGGIAAKSAKVLSKIPLVGLGIDCAVEGLNVVQEIGKGDVGRQVCRSGIKVTTSTLGCAAGATLAGSLITAASIVNPVAGTAIAIAGSILGGMAGSSAGKWIGNGIFGKSVTEQEKGTK